MKDEAIYDCTLMLADSSLVMAQRLSEWTGHGPMLEQGIALTNITLDLIGQARLLYQFAAELQQEPGNPDVPVSEDTIAYLRDAHQYKNLLMAELPNGHWGQTVLKVLLYSHYLQEVYGRLIYSPVTRLAAIAEKSLKEVKYHIKWSSEWTKRMGDGTEESHEKMLHAFEFLWPYTGEMFAAAHFEIAAFAKQDNLFDSMQQEWLRKVSLILREATIPLPPADAYMHSGGKTGTHTEHLGFILAEMQFLQRAYPGCEW